VKVDQLQKELAAGKVRPAYLLAGEEPLLRDDGLAAISDAILSGGPADFNFERLEGGKTTPAALRDALHALPVMAPRRLVVLRDPEPKRGAGKELVEALPELLAELCAQDQITLAICADKVDKRSRWVKAFKEPAALVECEAPNRTKDIAAFLKREAGRQGVELEPGAAECLVEEVGPQLLMLRQELGKLALLAGEGNAVSRAHIEALAIRVADDPVWDLTDAIGEGRRSDALVLLARMHRAGAAPPALLGALASHFRKLSRLKGGGSVGGPPFALRKLERQSRRFSPVRLLACLEAIHDADLALKGAGAIRPELALERLVLGLAS